MGRKSETFIQKYSINSFSSWPGAMGSPVFELSIERCRRCLRDSTSLVHIHGPNVWFISA